MKDNKAKYMLIFKINKLLKINGVSLKKSYSLENWQNNKAINGSTYERDVRYQPFFFFF